MTVLEPGTTFADKYLIDGVLGKGGMGAVYSATNQSIGRRVAIKVLVADLADRDDIKARFSLEARAAAVINHPGIVDVDAELHEWDAGVSSTYAYSDTSTSLSGVYFLPDLKRGIREVAAAGSFLSQQWGAAASFRTPAGDLTEAMQERVPGGGQQIVLGTSVPVGDTFSFRLRNLDGGAGVPAVVASSVEQGWLFVGWRDTTSIRVRKVCAP